MIQYNSRWCVITPKNNVLGRKHNAVHVDNVNYTKKLNRSFPILPKLSLLNQIWYQHISRTAYWYILINESLYIHNLVTGHTWHDDIAIELLSPAVKTQWGLYVYHMQQTTFYILDEAIISWAKNTYHVIINYV